MGNRVHDHYLAIDKQRFWSEICSEGATVNRILHHRENTMLCFITAENPLGMHSSESDNAQWQERIKVELRRLNFGYVPVLGKNNNDENSFCVISYKGLGIDFVQVMKKLAEKYKQQSIVFALEGQEAYLWYPFGDPDKNIHAGGTSPLRDKIQINDSSAQILIGDSSIKEHHFVFESAFSPQLFGMSLLVPHGRREELLASSFPVVDVISEPNRWDWLVPLFSVKIVPVNERRLTIRQRYMFADDSSPEKFFAKKARFAMRNFGMDPENAKSVIKHWNETDEITSSSGPYTYAEWSLYDQAIKMHDSGLSYFDAIVALGKDTELQSKEVKDIIGTSEEWRLGYFDDGLRPLAEYVKKDYINQGIKANN